nr:ROK family protein [Thermoleophilaceae bacterium]
MPAHDTGTTPAPGPVLGIDVGGTKVAVAEIDGGQVRRALERPTDTTDAAALLAGVEAAAKEIVEETGRPAAIGVGVPSQIEFATGRVVQSSNIPLEGVALREELEGRLGAPVLVDNDANCAALAEAHAAPEEPVARNLVTLTLGTGVGGGVVIDGRIFRGSSGLGAELGHMVIDPHGPECPGRCPNRGCLEAFCSGTALEREATDLGRRQPDSALGRAVVERG